MAELDEMILLVDDEEGVLSSLKRLFRPEGYRVATASSADEALDILAHNAIWLVLSDNSMPGKNGIQFLKEVRDRWPDVIRMMLTGYTDFSAATEAINRGEVYRFVTKPWDPGELKMLVRQGLDQYRLVDENRRMQALISEQNARLKGWNETLKQTVDQRTVELRQKNGELEDLYRQLKGSFLSSIKVFTDIIELRNPAIAGHARRVAGLSESLAVQIGMSEEDVRSVEIAGLLHDIGKIGLPDDLLRKRDRLLAAGERALMRQHPVLGQAVLHTVDSLEVIGVLVRHHHERWDGTGYPDQMRGETIPLGSRVIAVADSFDYHRDATAMNYADFISAFSGAGDAGAFDPLVLQALRAVAEGDSAKGQAAEVAMGVRDLREGMALARDLRTATGLLLIPKGETLRQAYLYKLVLYERQRLIPSTVYVSK